MDTKRIKVSILVPVYGVAKYIERCAISILEQTYCNTECIFVNDASLDNSWELLEKVVCRYPNTIVKLSEHNKNEGIAETRNSLLKMASGDFVMFVDGDDWLENDAVDLLVRQQILTNADYVIPNYTIYRKNCIEIISSQSISSISKENYLRQLLSGKVSHNLFGKLFRRELFKNFCFAKGANFAEDLMGVCKLAYYADSFAILDKSIYNYEARNISSYTKNFTSINSKQSLINLDELKQFFRNTRYEKYVLAQEACKVAGHMYTLARDRNNFEYYTLELIPRLKGIPADSWHNVDFIHRVPLYVKNFWFVHCYSLILGMCKKITKREE